MVQTRLVVIGQVNHNGRMNYSKLHLKMHDCKAAKMQHCAHKKRVFFSLPGYIMTEKVYLHACCSPDLKKKIIAFCIFPVFTHLHYLVDRFSHDRDLVIIS